MLEGFAFDQISKSEKEYLLCFQITKKKTTLFLPPCLEEKHQVYSIIILFFRFLYNLTGFTYFNLGCSQVTKS